VSDVQSKYWDDLSKSWLEIGQREGRTSTKLDEVYQLSMIYKSSVYPMVSDHKRCPRDIAVISAGSKIQRNRPLQGWRVNFLIEGALGAVLYLLTFSSHPPFYIAVDQV
jgi:hypothetical protein